MHIPAVTTVLGAITTLLARTPATPQTSTSPDYTLTCPLPLADANTTITTTIITTITTSVRGPQFPINIDFSSSLVVQTPVIEIFYIHLSEQMSNNAVYGSIWDACDDDDMGCERFFYTGKAVFPEGWKSGDAVRWVDDKEQMGWVDDKEQIGTNLLWSW